LNSKVDMSTSCGSCGKKIQDYPLYCHTCDDYFCSEQCHASRHDKQWQNFWFFLSSRTRGASATKV